MGLNVIDASLVKPLGLTPISNILSRGIVGEPVKAQLVQLQIRRIIHDEIGINDHDG